MKYSYDFYKMVTFTLPLIRCSIFGLGILLCIILIVKSHKRIFTRSNLINLIVLLGAIFVLVRNVIFLSYGYKILLDKKDNTAVIQGEIETIEEAFGSPLYKLDYENSRGHIISISGEEYYIMSVRGLSVGDDVQITYLKNSKFVVGVGKKNGVVIPDNKAVGVSVEKTFNSTINYGKWKFNKIKEDNQ